MEQFMLMLADIIKRYRSELNSYSHASNRLNVINNMKAELLAMKEVYEATNGPIKPNETTFEEILKQIN